MAVDRLPEGKLTVVARFKECNLLDFSFFFKQQKKRLFYIQEYVVKFSDDFFF